MSYGKTEICWLCFDCIQLILEKLLYTVREHNAIYTSSKKHACLVKINYVIIINIPF